MCIVGYVTRKDKDQDVQETKFYYEHHGKYTGTISRGGLKEPGGKACQWTMLGFVMFSAVKEKVCRSSINKILMKISEFHDFGMQMHHCAILSNIFLKNFSKEMSPISTKEGKLKVLKLSDEKFRFCHRVMKNK